MNLAMQQNKAIEKTHYSYTLLNDVRVLAVENKLTISLEAFTLSHVPTRVAKLTLVEIAL